MVWSETKNIVGGLNAVYCRCPDANKCGGGGNDNGEQLVYSWKSSQENLPMDCWIWGPREKKPRMRPTFCAQLNVLFWGI